jgi:small subunit ribosomal protein S16
MLVIRLFRIGKKNQPSFKIVVTDKTKPPRAGRFVEEVGFYNPKTKEKVLKAERIKYWLSVGAKPSDTLYNLLVSEKVVEGKKVPIYMKKVKKEEKPVTEMPPKEEKPVSEKPAEEKPTEEKSEEKAAQEPPKTE